MMADIEGAVVIGFSNDNVVTHNRMTEGGSSVITESADRTVVTDNVVTHSIAALCDGCGIAVQIYGNDNLAARNTTGPRSSPRFRLDTYGER
jgi:hypothetical protein